MNDPQPEGHMASYIGRRKFLAALGGAVAAWPLAARAQQSERMRRIGVLMNTTADDPEQQSGVAQHSRSNGYGVISDFEWTFVHFCSCLPSMQIMTRPLARFAPSA